MAAYTSSQTGNWSSSSTWGGAGVPGDGDTWTVGAGHTVTYDVTTYQTTGLDDGTVNNTGRLTFSTGGRLRLNGKMNVYGDLIMGSDTVISIVGANNADHGIYIRHPTTTSTFHRVEMQGSTGMPETTLSSAITTKQGYLPVGSATSFAAGDWISAFKRGLTDKTQRTDEGFIVHDVDSNNIYVREFVGPSATITAVDDDIITVDNAKIFREWQTVIFGTGANRNVHNITDINNTTNQITLASSVTGSVIGETVYTSGPIRQKNSGDIVRKVACQVTADALSSATSFTVSSAAGFNIGDEIVVDSLLESDNYTDERPERRTITDISGTTITVNSSFGYPILTTAWCVRLTRDCTIQTDDGATNYGYFRIIENTVVNTNNVLVMKDVQFRNMGTSVDDNRSRGGPFLAGRYYNDAGYIGIEIEGVTSHRDGARNLTNAGFYIHRWYYQWVIRNCVSFESVQGIWHERGYEGDDCAFYNNYSARSESSLFRHQDARYEYSEFAYNYGNRGDNQSLYITANRCTGIGIHHNWMRVSQSTGVNFNLAYGSFSFFQNKIEGCFNSAIYGFNNGMGNFVYNYIDTSRPLDFTLDSSISYTRLGADPNHSAILLEHNFERDAVCEFFHGGKRTWIPEENAWFIEHDDDTYSSVNGTGHIEIIYVPPDATLRVRSQIKLSDNFSGSAPKLEVREITNRGPTTHNFISGHNGNPMIPYLATQSATTNAGWQNVDLTVPPTKYGTRYMIGMVPVSGNSSSAEGEGWYEKPLKIYFDKPLPTQEYAGINRYSASEIGTRTSLNERIVRLGGSYI